MSAHSQKRSQALTGGFIRRLTDQTDILMYPSMCASASASHRAPAEHCLQRGAQRRKEGIYALQLAVGREARLGRHRSSTAIGSRATAVWNPRSPPSGSPSHVSHMDEPRSLRLSWKFVFLGTENSMLDSYVGLRHDHLLSIEIPSAYFRDMNIDGIADEKCTAIPVSDSRNLVYLTRLFLAKFRMLCTSLPPTSCVSPGCADPIGFRTFRSPFWLLPLAAGSKWLVHVNVTDPQTHRIRLAPCLSRTMSNSKRDAVASKSIIDLFARLVAVTSLAAAARRVFLLTSIIHGHSFSRSFY